MNGDAGLEAVFRQMLDKVSPQMSLLERLTRDQLDFFHRSPRCRPAFLRVENGNNWILALYPPKPGAEPRFRIRTSTLTETNAVHLHQAFAKAGLAAEITTKNQKFAEGSGVVAMRPVWRVDLAPETWSRIDEGLIRLTRQHLREVRYFGILNFITDGLGYQPGHSPGAALRWVSTDEGGFRLTLPQRDACLLMERALGTAGIEFTVREQRDTRAIELLPAFVERILRDPSLAWQAKETIAGLGIHDLHGHDADGMPHAHADDAAARTTETFISHRYLRQELAGR